MDMTFDVESLAKSPILQNEQSKKSKIFNRLEGKRSVSTYLTPLKAYRCFSP